MSVRVACDECGKKYRIPEERLGRIVRCRDCGAELPVDDVGEEQFEAPRRRRRSPNPRRKKTAGKSRGIPPSVITAMAATGVLLLVDLIAIVLFVRSRGKIPVDAALFLVVGILILIGMLFRHRLAWQWGRLATVLGAVVMTVVTLGVFVSDPADFNGTSPALVGMLTLAETAALWTIFVALLFPSAQRYFRLICPKCGKATSSAADFLFNVARCNYCNYQW